MKRRLAAREQGITLSVIRAYPSSGDYQGAVEARKRRCRVNAPSCRTAYYCTVCGCNQYRLCRLGRAG